MKKQKRILKLIFALLLAVFLLGAQKITNQLTPQPSPTPAHQTYAIEIATVSAVIDGDTIELTDKRRVRYIGIDTPETKHPNKGVECFGKEAAQKNKELVEGKTITMQKDISETDKYKRLLRYVWVEDVFINDVLVREGFAVQSTFPPDVAHAKKFEEAAQEARTKDRGLWKSCK